MDSLLGVLNEDNVRTLVMLVAVVCGAIWLDKRFDKKMDDKMDKRDLRMDKKFEAIDKRFEAIDKRFEAIDKKFEAKFEAFEAFLDKKFDDFYVKLKTNDFAHLSAAIEALAYVLKKNGLIDSDDNKFIDSKLDKI